MRSSGTAPAARELIVEILQQVVGGERVETVFALRAATRRGAAASLRSSRTSLPMAEPELDRAARPFAFPERHLARLARRGRDEHAIVRDLLDAPGRRAEQERFAGARLEDHLFVELADARLVLVGAGRKTPYSPRSGIVPAFAIATRLAPCRAVDRAVHAIPRDTRPQLGEFVRGIAAGQHVEHAVERRARLSSANGAADRDRANRSSTTSGPSTTIATSCCASTSSGLRG